MLIRILGHDSFLEEYSRGDFTVLSRTTHIVVLSTKSNIYCVHSIQTGKLADSIPLKSKCFGGLKIIMRKIYSFSLHFVVMRYISRCWFN